jgi:hypothetical protein
MTRGHTFRALPLLVAVAGLLGACSADSTGSSPADGTSVAEPTPTSTPSPAQTTYSPKAGDVQVLPDEPAGYAVLGAGRYELRVTPSLAYQLDVPDDWGVHDGRYLNGADGLLFVTPAAADDTQVPKNPCTQKAQRDVGPTVADLATALRRQPVLEVTDPVPVRLGGHRGLSIDVRIPGDTDFDKCVDQSVAFFSSGADAWDWPSAYAGQWWILDVDGERVVVQASCDPGSSHECREVLRATVQSITFTPDA